MKKSILVLAICSFLTVAALSGCSTSAQKVENAKESVLEANNDLDKANKELQADMAIYRLETADRIAANDQAIIDYNARMAHEKKNVKAEIKEKISELKQKNDEMKQKMKDYKEDGKEKWQVFKAEFSHDMDELGKAFKDLTVKNVQ